MINRTNTVLAVLLVVVVGMAALVAVDYSQPNIEILPDMKYTPASEAFASNLIFPDGRTMQPPVAGTIPRGQLPLHYVAGKEDAVRAGEELSNPYSLSALEAAASGAEGAETSTEASGESAPEEPAPEEPAPEEPAPDESAPASDARPTAEAGRQDEATLRAARVREQFSASVEHGGEVYRRFCISCHGPKGAGDGPVTQRGFPPPPSMLTGKSRQMKDGQLFHILTYGQGSMEPFAAQLPRDHRWDVINYVRDLQSKAPPPSTTQPAEPVAVPPTEAPAAPTEAPAAPTEEKEEATNAEPSENEVDEASKVPTNALRDPARGRS